MDMSPSSVLVYAIKASLLFFLVTSITVRSASSLSRKIMPGASLVEPDETKSTFLTQPSTLSVFVPRAFHKFKAGPISICHRGFNFTNGHSRKPLQEGMLYVKPSKAASSTAAGVNLRIAQRTASKLNRNFSFCDASYWHGNARDFFQKRTISKSFLWTVIREPTARIQSNFFHFKVSREKIEPTDENFRMHAERQVNSYLGLLPFEDYRITNKTANSLMQSVLDGYDFIGISERFDESMVALHMILGVPIADVLYLSSKSSGGFDDGKSSNGCTYIMPKFLTSGMRTFFSSSKWQSKISRETSFYRAVNESLDLTINYLGRGEFERHLSLFRRLLAKATTQCANTVFPCLESGAPSREEGRDCLYSDSGCGATCLDNVAMSEVGVP